MSDNTVDDAALEATYREWPTLHLKRTAVAFALDQAEAYYGGPERERFIERRLTVIRKVLAERGETSPADNLFGDPE